jgi:Mn2+/Fe2+ NRAMP family transporter
MVAQDGSAAMTAGAETLPPPGPDVAIWAFLIAIITSYLLFKGSYKLIEKIVVGLVASFTLLSVANFIMLQFSSTWAITWADIGNGLSFKLPPGDSGKASLYTALATFGIIGVGAGELIFYPYWCLEKGYAKFIGPKDDSEEWGTRAKGWMRVMRWDAWLSMVVYTLSTVVFYLLGATVLHRAGLVPEGNELIRTLSAMFEPVFGQYAVGLFLVGSIFVLYSTFLVGMGSNALVFSDVLEIFSRHRGGTWCRKAVRPWIGFALPLIAFVMLLLFPEPTTLILLAGASLTLLLPILAFAAVYFRYKFSDSRLHSGILWDICLWISSVALFGIGMWLVFTVLGPRIVILFQ